VLVLIERALPALVDELRYSRPYGRTRGLVAAHGGAGSTESPRAERAEQEDRSRVSRELSHLSHRLHRTPVVGEGITSASVLRIKG
jgi:hypothetical protein